MQAPAAHYVTTPDGFEIAYAVSGSGPPLVLTPSAFSHIQMAWEIPSSKAWLEGLSQRFQLVQLDYRGQGLSTRGLPKGFTIADYETDLETVVDHLELERFFLLGTCITGHAAVRFAAKQPQRLLGLILLTTAASMRAWPIDLLTKLANENGDLLLWSGLVPGFSPVDGEPRLDRIKQAMTLEDATTRWRGSVGSDVSELLPKISTPTLVMHPQIFVHLKAEEATKLASGLPNASLVMLESDDPGNLRGRLTSVFAAIDDFRASLALVPANENAGRHKLSRRQTEVLALLTKGRTNREIATELVLSLRTVERHVEELYSKLDVRNRAEAVALGLGRLGEK